MFGQKPAFGSSGGGFGGFGTTTNQNPGFGGGTTSAFGQTSFGGFGNAGAATTTSSTSGLFNNQGGGGGGSIFGQAGQQQPQQPFGSFGSQPASGGFGGTAFNNKPGFGGFGSTASTTTTSGGGGGLFSSNNPSTGLFGSGGFGATTTTTPSAGTSFGAPSSSSAFGAFGQQQQQQQGPNGTTIKFDPPSGTDTMMKSGNSHTISTRHQCISCMKEYENKSLEELRCEDYVAGRKNGATSGGMGLFGQQQPAASTSGSLFGAQSGSIFGQQQQQQQQQQQNKPIFGAASTANTGFGASTGFGNTGFGATNTSTAGGIFKAPNAFGATTTATTAPSTGFGFNNSTSLAGGGIFDQQAKPAFGQAQAGIFGSSGGFGAPTSSAAPAFGQTNTQAFGQQQNASIGLFGQPANKTMGFGAPTTAGFNQPAPAGSSFGGFGATTSTANPFGQANKPAFGFGASSAPAASTTTPSFGFGAPTSTQSVGIFGQKPAGTTFSFGNSQPAAGGFSNPPTSTFGSTGGNIFGTAQNKPGGLFGATAPTGTVGAFGTTGGFGATSFNLGGTQGSNAFGSFGTGTLGTGLQQPYGATNMVNGVIGQAQPVTSNIIHQSLASLSANPYGENKLFKTLLQTNGKLEEVLKPTNPASQKAINAESSLYKLSPRRAVRVKAKPLSASGNKSAIFDGLEDDDINPKYIFVPRPSTKKLVLKAKSSSLNNTPQHCGVPASPGEVDEDHGLSLTIPLTKSSQDASYALSPIVSAGNDISVVDESFAALNTRNKHKKSLDPSVYDEAPAPSNPATAITTDDEGGLQDGGAVASDSGTPHPAGIILNRNDYYTIPSMAELGSLVDADGNCFVEGFTIGRNGYGNIYFPGVINVAGMNLDEYVFIRHKEVIVYPDDDKKPELGEGLNRKAQITLDKVWPVDKVKRQPITDPEKLLSLSYEDKLEKASIKLGARFTEYRSETGSWVFKVDHFSKYGLEDSDEEDAVPPLIVKTSVDPNKKLKTLQLELRDQSGNNNNNNIIITNDKININDSKENNAPNLNEALSDDYLRKDKSVVEDVLNNTQNKISMSSGDVMSPTSQQLIRINAQNDKVQMMKASLFDDDNEDDEEMIPVDMDIPSETRQPKSRPVILEPRSSSEASVIAPREKFIEDIAHSMLTGSQSRGLGGSYSFDQAGNNITSSLLRNQFLSQFVLKKEHFKPSPSISSKGSVQINYSLTKGYDSFVTLPSSGVQDRPRTVIPKFYDKVPLKESLLFKKFDHLSDAGLFMSRSFRCGWGSEWRLANVGESLDVVRMSLDSAKGPFDVTVEKLKNFNGGKEDEDRLSCLESWLQVSLDNSEFSHQEDGEIPFFSSRAGVETLHSFVEEAERQYSSFDSACTEFANELKLAKEVWSLCKALWGNMTNWNSSETRIDSHETTMIRRKALSEWLEAAILSETEEREDSKMVISGEEENSVDSMGEILRLLTSNQIEEACDRAHNEGNHMSAMLMSQFGGGVPGSLVFNQMDRWQEAHADRFMSKKTLQFYALVAGNPVWPASDGDVINTCENLDWKSSFAYHLWYLCSPVASIVDALNLFYNAFEGHTEFGVYASAPLPKYIGNEGGESYDIAYHLLRLYCDRSHSLEALLSPSSHTRDPLDYRLSWFICQVLFALGYRHMSLIRKNDLTASFASQLENMGLWQWCIYVLLHLDNSSRRKAMVMDVLCRGLRKCSDASDIEEFLVEKLNIPYEWIAEARAMLAASDCRFIDQAWYLLRAEQWNKSHEVLVKKIAPDAVINEDYEFLYKVLEELVDNDPINNVQGWNTSGQIFYDFINVDRDVNKLKAKRDEASVTYFIDKLKPEVVSLCSRISKLKTETAKERLCQSEIAKRVAYLMRAVLTADCAMRETSKAQSSRILAESLSQLPLPDDYVLQELRTLTKNYMLEIMEH